MSKRAARAGVTPEAAALIRAAFEPRYGRVLVDADVDGIADRLRRFADVLVEWEGADRTRAAADSGSTPVLSPPPRAPRAT